MARAAGCRLGPDQQRRVPDFQPGHRKGPTGQKRTLNCPRLRVRAGSARFSVGQNQT